MCLYFSAHLNKTQFAKILEFSAVTSQNIYPKSFSECSNALLNLFNEKIEREKKWYCTSCSKFVKLTNQYQRCCLECGKRQVKFNLLTLFNANNVYFEGFHLIFIYQLKIKFHEL